MARRPLPPGAHGRISIAELPGGMYEARCRYRAFTGQMHRLARRGPSSDAAQDALLRHIVELSAEGARGQLSPDTLVSEIADLWISADIEVDVVDGVLSPTTLDVYRSILKRWVTPRLGALRARELTGTACDQLIKDARKKRSVDTASTVRTVLNGLCTYAVRHGALATNPVKSAKRLRRGRQDKRAVTVMTIPQIAEMLTALTAYGQTRQRTPAGHPVGARARVWLDLPDLALAMLATGARLGEALALRPEDVVTDSDGTRVVIDAHIVRVKGKGLLRLPGRKSNRPAVEPIVPNWAAKMFARRVLAAAPTGPLFGTADGDWLDPSNTASRLREALTEAGYDWVTSHVWRHTVGTILAEAGLPVDDIAAVLGNTRDVAERYYILRPKSNPRATAALEAAVANADVKWTGVA